MNTINETVTHIFDEMAVFLEMEGIAFKPRAYEKAAESIRDFPQGLDALYQQKGRKGLDALSGVGLGLAEKIEEFLKTKRIAEYERFKKKYPIHISELRAVEGVGPKMILMMYKKLGVRTLRDLRNAVQQKKLRDLPGFGEKKEGHIAQSLAFLEQNGNRRILGAVLPLAEHIELFLQSVPGVKHAAVAGSIRRRQETIGDIDILVTASQHSKVLDAFVRMDEVASVVSKGARKAHVRLKNGMAADLLVVDDESFGAALQYFTGDKQHTILVREIAAKKGMKLNEYGLWKGKKRLAAKTEKDIYHALGMEYIEPELRTGSGEIEAALHNALPHIISYGSVRGDLQTQTHWTDGSASIHEMAQAALGLGREYIAITDHTKTLAIARGLDEKGLGRQAKEINKENLFFKKKGFHILKGAEVNILKDGSLDISNAALKKLDIVGIAVHSHFKLSRSAMTERIIRAMKNPFADVLYHPTGRLINKRPGYEVDMEKIIRAAKEYHVALEINAYPERSDLRDEYVRMAVQAGAKLVIDTDAHAPEHLKYIPLGEAIARRGWAEHVDILNTLPFKKCLAYFRRYRTH